MSNIEKKLLGESISVLMTEFTATKTRYVLHNDISDDDTEKVIKKIKYVIEELSKWNTDVEYKHDTTLL